LRDFLRANPSASDAGRIGRQAGPAKDRIRLDDEPTRAAEQPRPRERPTPTNTLTGGTLLPRRPEVADSYG